MVALFFGLLACAGDGADDTGSTLVAADYGEPGPFSAGTLDDDVAGSTGETLQVQVWFPSADAGQTTVTYDGLYPDSAFTDVSAACDTPRPVLLFSHGYGGIRWQSPFLGDHLASHGWLVVAPDHAGNTIFDNDDSRFEELVTRRPADIAETFDWLVAASADDSGPLAGCVDEAAGYAVAGHSFGGYTAYATGGAVVNDPSTGGQVDLSDPRVWAVLAWAPWDAGGALTNGTSAIVAPVMTLTGLLDETTPPSMVTGMHGALTATPRYLGTFATAGHYSFSPIACTFAADSGNGCGDDYVDIDVFTGIVQVATLAFLESTMGIPGAVEQLPPQDGELSWEIDE